MSSRAYFITLYTLGLEPIGNKTVMESKRNKS